MLDILIAIIAVYGAALSTYMLVRRVRSDKTKVVVTHGWSYNIRNNRMDNRPEYLGICAVNHSRKEVVVQSLSLEIPGLCLIAPGFLEIYGGDKSPNNRNLTEDTRLRCGDKAEVSFDCKMLRAMLNKHGYSVQLRVRAVCEDTLENVYYSSWFEIGEGLSSRQN